MEQRAARASRRVPLYESVALELLRCIERNEWRRGERLPSEPELARRFAVSRATLREAIRVLEDRGLIIRRHGIGSFVTGPTSKVPFGIEKLENFVDVLKRVGKNVRDDVLLLAERVLPSETWDVFAHDQGRTAWEVRALRFVDDVPAILSVDYIPTSVIAHRARIERRRQMSLLDLLREIGFKPEYQFLTLHAIAADEDLGRELQVAAGTPLLFWAGFVYDGSRRPLTYSMAYFRTDHVQVTLVRRANP